MSLRPLIAICGTTGVGKSKLAIELALSLFESNIHGWRGARVINADSMQVYAGMDIITNKVPEAERKGIEHLLMGFKRPGEQYVVGQWVRDAMQVIDDTHNKNQIPIVVGGTSYWLQNLLFPSRLMAFDEITSTPSESAELSRSISQLPPPLLELFNALPDIPPQAWSDPDRAYQLHSLLALLDPCVASRWHWKDTRKVLRSLVIIKESGRRTSDILTDQSISVSEPRYRTLVFWLYAEPSIINPRLDSRVDQMIEQGLIDEIRELRTLAMSSSIPSPSDGICSEPHILTIDYTLGIYQAIGYKEFHEYLSMPSHSQKLLDESVANMKHATRKYAKRQISWIRNKLLPAIHAANIPSGSSDDLATDLMPTYLLDATELGQVWNVAVGDIAENIMLKFLQEKSLPNPLTLSDHALAMLAISDKPTTPTTVLKARHKIICPVCTIDLSRPVMIEEGTQWAAHQKTRLHRRLASKGERQDVSVEDQCSKQAERSRRKDVIDNDVVFNDGTDIFTLTTR